ncbi:uncharacterized protein LOC134349314 [Mobula hypostoma]|uniref:uncharacterized protein LOC134349314 n=1 Tax=Mobula hypostoma TaxID=723540 RepID=UPI002FC3A5B2
MNSLDQTFLFEKIPKENNKRKEFDNGANFVSEIWFKNLSSSSNTDSNFISENKVERTETDNQVLAENYGQHKVNTGLFGIPASTDRLSELGNFTSTVKSSTESLLFFKANDTLSDSPGSYHTAVCSDVPENLSDCSGPYEDIEELASDHNESQDASERGVLQGFADSQKEQSNDWLNSSEIETSLMVSSLAPHFNCWEEQEQRFMNKHEMKLSELNVRRELTSENMSSGLHGRNVPDVNSDCKMDVRLTLKTADEKNSFGNEITSSPQEERKVCGSDMVDNDTLLTAKSNSNAQGVDNKSTKCDLTETSTNRKDCSRNGDQQVHLSITAQNSKAAMRSNGVQLLQKQEPEANIHECPGCYLHLGLNEHDEMSQKDESENGSKNDSCINGKRNHADSVSETSSFASELDETDYEVRKLTALAFRSLSCPNDNYFHIYNSGGFFDFSPSLSEDCYYTNRVSACSEPDGMGAADITEQCPDFSYRVCALYDDAEESKMLLSDSSDRIQFECVDVAVESQDKEGRASRTVPKRQIELRKPQRSELKVFTSKDTVHSSAYFDPAIEMGNSEETLECLQFSESAPYAENTINTNAENKIGNNKLPQQAIYADGQSPKNKFASCLLTNVISKKMQREQDLMIDQEFCNLPHVSIIPATTFEKKEDFALSPIAFQQMMHETSASKSESSNSLDFVQDNLRISACELNDDNTEENGNLDQKRSHSSLQCEGALILSAQNNKTPPNCRRTNVLKKWREGNIDSQTEADAERTLELSTAKSCTTFNDLSINAAWKENNLSAPCMSVDKCARVSSQSTEQNPDLNDSVRCEVAPYEDKTDDTQLNNYSYKTNASSDILAPTSRKMLYNSRKANVKRSISHGNPRPARLTPDFSFADLDLKNRMPPVLLRFKSAKTKLSQYDIKDNIFIKNKTKFPTYVRDVKKLSQNNYFRSPSCATKAKCDVLEEVGDPSSTKKQLPATLHKAPVIDNSCSPIFIQCQSVSRKSDIDDSNHVAADKKCLISSESSDTSRLFSSDFKLPIPCKKQDNKVTSAERICKDDATKDNENRIAEPLNNLTNVLTPERKMQVIPISNNKEFQSPLTKVQVEEETPKISSANFLLNNKITAPRESKQQNDFQAALETLKVHPSSSGSTFEDTVYSLTNKETNQEIQCELENKNSNSNEEDIQMERYKDEHGWIPERIRSHKEEKGIHTKLEIQDHPLGVICYNNEQVDLSNGKNDPQDGSQVCLESHNTLFSNSTSSNKSIEKSYWKGDPNDYINNGLQHPNECLKKSTSNDKETQTPTRKSKLKKELKFKLENENKMLENLTSNNECLELQVNSNEHNKLFEISAFNGERNELLSDDVEDQVAPEADDRSEMAFESKGSKSASDMQSGLPNETDCPPNSSSNITGMQSSSVKNNLKEGIDYGVENQSKLQNHITNIKLQEIKDKSNHFKTESTSSQRTDDKVPTAEDDGLTVISESQLNKVSNNILTVSEKEKQGLAKECSKSSNSKTADEQLSTLKAQIPNEISVPVISALKTVIPLESSSCSETIKRSADASFQEIEDQNVCNKLEFSAAIQKMEVNTLLAPQTPSCFTNLNVKSIISNNSVVNSSSNTTQDQEQQLSLEMEKLGMNNTRAQEDPSTTSAPINYLSIPSEEHKLYASPQLQMPASPQSVIHNADHYSTRNSSHHQNWETIDSHQQEQQPLHHQCLGDIFTLDNTPQHPFYTSSHVPNQAEPQLVHFTSTRKTPEKCYKVPQSPQLMDNPRLPCFQYSEAHKKVLIDPETGKHYFVEAPIQSPRKMLFDPETGCYIEVIIPQQPYGGFYQTPFSPHVLYPNTLRPSYIPRMQYSDLISTPLIAYPGLSPGSPEAQTQSQPNSTNACASEMQHHIKDMPKITLAETNYMESTYSTPMSASVNPNPTQSSTQVKSIHSEYCAEVKDNSNVMLSSQQI